MELVAIQDGHVTIRLHWTIARLITHGLMGKAEGEAELEVETLAALFEAGALAANLQLASVTSERMTLGWMRETGGDRMAMRHAANEDHIA